ncbi:MAG: hypothetical protein IT289_03520 [Oligoflexia bacterium]|nr:hypothetical protein [Oligoflexia bacterium]
MDAICEIAQICSGCPKSATPLETQHKEKSDHLAHLLKSREVSFEDPIDIKPTVSWRSRDRADLTVEIQSGAKTIGLFKTGTFEVADMINCAQMSAELEEWLIEFRKFLPPVQKGSVRLRVAPDKTRGLWLDFSNNDVKMLFDDSSWLRTIPQDVIIEVGQRRKRLNLTGNRPKLEDPQFFPWFETYRARDLAPLAIFSQIASFSQPGRATNKVLIQEFYNLLSLTQSTSWLEIFCGFGNFTLALASYGYPVCALELDSLAIEGVKKSSQAAQLEHLIDIRKENALKLDPSRFQRDMGLLVDPPRSGLGKLLDTLSQVNPKKLPQDFIYVSCFADSLSADLARLESFGYKIQKVLGVDQFPQSAHCEWLCLLKNAN